MANNSNGNGTYTQTKDTVKAEVRPASRLEDNLKALGYEETYREFDTGGFGTIRMKGVGGKSKGEKGTMGRFKLDPESGEIKFWVEGARAEQVKEYLRKKWTPRLRQMVENGTQPGWTYVLSPERKFEGMDKGLYDVKKPFEAQDITKPVATVAANAGMYLLKKVADGTKRLRSTTETSAETPREVQAANYSQVIGALENLRAGKDVQGKELAVLRKIAEAYNPELSTANTETLRTFMLTKNLVVNDAKGINKEPYKWESTIILSKDQKSRQKADAEAVDLLKKMNKAVENVRGQAGNRTTPLTGNLHSLENAVRTTYPREGIEAMPDYGGRPGKDVGVSLANIEQLFEDAGKGIIGNADDVPKLHKQKLQRAPKELVKLQGKAPQKLMDEAAVQYAIYQAIAETFEGMDVRSDTLKVPNSEAFEGVYGFDDGNFVLADKLETELREKREVKVPKGTVKLDKNKDGYLKIRMEGDVTVQEVDETISYLDKWYNGTESDILAGEIDRLRGKLTKRKEELLKTAAAETAKAGKGADVKAGDTEQDEPRSRRKAKKSGEVPAAVVEEQAISYIKAANAMRQLMEANAVDPEHIETYANAKSVDDIRRDSLNDIVWDELKLKAPEKAAILLKAYENLGIIAKAKHNEILTIKQRYAEALPRAAETQVSAEERADVAQVINQVNTTTTDVGSGNVSDIDISRYATSDLDSLKESVVPKGIWKTAASTGQIDELNNAVADLKLAAQKKREEVTHVKPVVREAQPVVVSSPYATEELTPTDMIIEVLKRVNDAVPGMNANVGKTDKLDVIYIEPNVRDSKHTDTLLEKLRSVAKEAKKPQVQVILSELESQLKAYRENLVDSELFNKFKEAEPAVSEPQRLFTVPETFTDQLWRHVEEGKLIEAGGVTIDPRNKEIPPTVTIKEGIDDQALLSVSASIMRAVDETKDPAKKAYAQDLYERVSAKLGERSREARLDTPLEEENQTETDAALKLKPGEVPTASILPPKPAVAESPSQDKGEAQASESSDGLEELIAEFDIEPEKEDTRELAPFAEQMLVQNGELTLLKTTITRKSAEEIERHKREYGKDTKYAWALGNDYSLSEIAKEKELIHTLTQETTDEQLKSTLTHVGTWLNKEEQRLKPAKQ